MNRPYPLEYPCRSELAREKPKGAAGICLYALSFTTLVGGFPGTSGYCARWICMKYWRRGRLPCRRTRTETYSRTVGSCRISPRAMASQRNGNPFASVRSPVARATLAGNGEPPPSASIAVRVKHQPADGCARGNGQLNDRHHQATSRFCILG